MKNRALQIMTVLNKLIYGAFVVLFVLGCIELPMSSSGIPFIVFFIFLSPAIFVLASICGGVCYLILRSGTNEISARLITLVALFVAPFLSILTTYLLASLMGNHLSPSAIPVFFALPFVFAVIAAYQHKS